MTYGIDLGTTNSLVGTHGNIYSALVPSIVDMQNKVAGESQRNNYETLRGFKTSMNSDQGGLEAIVASSYVLKELKRVGNLPNNADVVISVPAYFNNSQRMATVRAAELADLHVVALINEPTAAAMAISKDTTGTSIVFDLGGGTFDISVISSTKDTYHVLATDGCILGGNDFDAALVTMLANKSNLSWRLMGDNKARDIVCKAKIKMQNLLNNKAPIPVSFGDYGVDTALTFDAYIECMKSVFGKALTLTRNVIQESGINMDTCNFYFVGGSTRCPFLREWIEQELGIVSAPITYNPDRIVAEGACYYAKLIDEGKAINVLEDVSKQVGFAINGEVLDIIIPRNSRLPFTGVTTHIVSYDVPIKEFDISFFQGDSILKSECEMLGSMHFAFTEEKAPGFSVFDVEVHESIDGKITIQCSEILQEPHTITLEVL